MKVQSIAEQRIVGGLGLFKELKHNERPVCGYTILSSLSLYPPSFSVLPAISLEDGILHCEIVEGSFHANTFALFIQNLLEHMQPFPAPNSVIVMDNCCIHKNPFIQELIAAWYVSWQAYLLLLMIHSLEVSAVNFYHRILPTTIQSNLYSRGWSTFFIVMGTTLG